MTTLNPSHDPFRKSEGRHAQAVRQSSQYPDNLPVEDNESIDGDGPSRAKREARRRVRQQMPPMPDLRFEQSYLLSIRPYLTPRPTKKAIEQRGLVGEDEGDDGDEKAKDKHLTQRATEDDEVFHWGREVDVQWGMLSWVTLRDQLLSPLAQGALWGWAGLAFSASSMYLRQALYPASHVGKGRIVGGSGGRTSQAGGGDAVGQNGGWWNSWVKSWAGGLEAATA